MDKVNNYSQRVQEVNEDIKETAEVIETVVKEGTEIINACMPLFKACCKNGEKPEVTDFVTPTQVKPKEITQLEASAPSITTKVADKSLNARETKAEVMPPQTRQDRNVVDGDKK